MVYAMQGNIFISYRRKESIKDARALYERLRREFGEQRIFVDLEGIDPGEDFVVSLDGQLAKCEVLLVLIGRDWVRATDEHGARRLDDPNDFVRIEVSAALQRRIRVFPVLIDGAQPPQADELPEDLKPLVRRQAVSLDYGKFDGDVSRLARAIRKATEAPPAESPDVPPPASPLLPSLPPVEPVNAAATAAQRSRPSMVWMVASGALLVLAVAAVMAGSTLLLWLRVALSDVKHPPLQQQVRVQVEKTVERLLPTVGTQFGLMAGRTATPWELAQATLALPRSKLIEPEDFAAYVRARALPSCSCWTELLDKPDDGKAVFISGWVLAALARYRVAATPEELKFLLDNQDGDGWWPIFPVAGAAEFASSYATAWAMLGLYQQQSRGLVAPARREAVDQAIRKAAGWLVANARGARWTFYPLEPNSQVSVSISGTVLYALHEVQAPGLRAIDAAWLDALPDRVIGESETEYRVVPTQPVQATNAVEMIKLPWALAATVDAYPNGTLHQRAHALRWLEAAMSDPRVTSAAETEKRSWWRTELLLALRYSLP